ncbi:MAG: hypothetical protein OXP07_12225 [Defluviicoccus sp.]|nr:hypothetical protein [Defluviicoccus sp.]
MKTIARCRSLCAALLFIGISPAQAADVVIGVPNWPSAAATANILKVVLEDNLGVQVELQNGTNPVIFEAMDTGSMHVHPEVWLPNQANLHAKYVTTRGTVRMSPNGVPSFQGMCVTKLTAERTGIADISDLADPEMAKNFDTNGDGRGEVWVGASGWASTNIEKIRAKSYGYDETMELLELDEALAMANLDAAVAKKANHVFYCYTPNHMFALYDLAILKEPKHDASKWVVIQPTDDPEWLEKSSAPVAWDLAYLHVHYAASLEKSHPEAAALLSKVKLTTDQVSHMTFGLVVKKMSAADYAKQWAKENAELVDSWMK